MEDKERFVSQIGRAIAFVWKGSPFWMIFNVIFQILQGIFPILSLLLLKMMVDEITAAAGGTGEYERIVIIIVLTGIVTLGNNIVSLFTGWGSREQGRHMADYMNGIIMEKAGEVDYPFFENSRKLDTLERAAAEAQFRPGEIVNTIAAVLRNSVSLAGVLVILFRFHPLILVVLVFSALPGMFVRFVFSRKEFGKERQMTELERKSSYFQFLMMERDCAKEVRLFDLKKEITGTYEKTRKELRRIRHDLDSRQTLANGITSIFMVILVFAAYLWVAGNVFAGSVTVGAFVMFYQAFQRGQGFLRSFLGGAVNLYGHNLFLRNLYQFLDYEPAVKAPEDPRNPPVPLKGKVQFNNVSFAYPGTDRMILKELNLHLEPGEAVALVGLNGCGKTTLVKLLCRLYDADEGTVTLDNADVRLLSPDCLTEGVGVIFQDYMQYFLTVTQNIAYGDMSSTIDMKRVREAAERAGISDTIEELPQGYETVLGVSFSQGRELSGGQWQKIAMARAFYKDSPVIVLDEPTSSLDPKAEYELFNRFKDVLNEKTALLVSHRMATVRMADRICVMAGGRIAEEGNHEELMAKKGLYYELFTTQARNYQI